MAESFEFINNAPEVLKDFDEACIRALTRMGMQGRDYASDLAPIAEDNGGTLAQSIDFTVDEENKECYVGTPKEYGIYVEMGTGQYVDGGRKTPWVYKDEKTGEWVTTRGQKAQPYLKPAITDHIDTYKNIVKDEMGG